MPPRAAFELSTLVGAQIPKVTCLAAVSSGERLFAGSSDGNLAVYESRSDTTAAIRAGSFECELGETLRKGSGNTKDPKRAVTGLATVEGWRAVLGIIDGQLMAYDLHTYRPVISIAETKGATCFCFDEEAHMLYVGGKKRLQVFSWQSVGVLLRRELALPESPRVVATLLNDSSSSGSNVAADTDDSSSAVQSNNKVIMALKNDYYVIDTDTGALSGPLSLTGDSTAAAASMSAAGGAAINSNNINSSSSAAAGAGSVILPVKRSPVRGPRVLLSTGSRGILLDVTGKEQEERLTWSAPPITVQNSAGAFFVAALPGQIEVHDAATLAPVQCLDVSSGIVCMAGCSVSGPRGGYSYVGTSQTVQLLKMVPLQFQVDALADAGSYEDALSLCVMCSQDPTLLSGIATASIHERYAYELLSWSDFEGALGHFLQAGTPCSTVLGLFPELLPRELALSLPVQVDDSSSGSAAAGSSSSSTAGGAAVRPLTGASLIRAASALVRYLEQQQTATRAAAAAATCTAAAAAGAADASLQETGAADAQSTAVAADTALVSALLHCTPPRREAIVALVSDPRCACDLSATAPLLAAAGAACAEPLLWLYRGRGLHRQALGLLAEDRCVGTGGWSLQQYRRWVAGYLRQLWMSEDAEHPPLALQAAAPLLEADPALGLTVFTGEQASGSSSAAAAVTAAHKAAGRRVQKRLVGAGAQPLEAVAFLKGIAVPADAAAADADSTPGSASASAGESSSETQLPLTNGRALAIAYLQHLVEVLAGGSSSSSYSQKGSRQHTSADTVQHRSGTNGSSNSGSSGAASLTAQLHDELAYLLMEGLLDEQQQQQQQQQQQDKKTTTASAVVELYRRRLRAFLQSSTEYNPGRLLAIVPSHFLHEHALLLSRLARHEEALEIYLRQLKDPVLAEQYCDRVWLSNSSNSSSGRSRLCMSFPSSSSSSSSSSSADSDVYLSLVKVYLASRSSTATAVTDTNSSSNSTKQAFADGLDAAVALLEKHYDRVDPVKALQLLPPEAPVARVSAYLRRAVRHHDSQLRQAQVVHSLCRADFVNVKYELIQLQSAAQQVPAAAPAAFSHLGTIRCSSAPTELAAESDTAFSVACTRHTLTAHIVLQFDVTNRLQSAAGSTAQQRKLQQQQQQKQLQQRRLTGVHVHCEPADPDIVTVISDTPIAALLPGASGTCYIVLELGAAAKELLVHNRSSSSKTVSSTGDSSSSDVLVNVACELRYSAGGAFGEEYPLEDVEITAADLR